MPGLSFSWTAPKQKKPITISGSGSIQGSTVNPQQTVTVSTYQPAATTSTYQRTVTPSVVQGGSSSAVQRAATAQDVQAAAAAVRLAAEKAAAEAAAQRRLQAQKSLDSKVATNKSAIELDVKSALPHVRVGKSFTPAKINVPHFMSPEDEQYQQWLNEGRKQAEKQIENMLSDPSTDRWSRLIDKVSFGSDRRKMNARKFSEKYAKEYAGRQIKIYQSKIDAHNKLQAQLQADYERKKFVLGASELSSLADDYNSRIAASAKDLSKMAALTEGKIAGYDSKSQMKINSAPAKLFSKTNAALQWVASDKNPVWRGTLGGGWENVPSLVTAPSRVVNWAGNLNTKDRVIQKYGGQSFNRTTSGKNAWQATFNQRNINLKPWIDIKPSQAPKELRDQVRGLIETRKKIGVTDSKKLDYNTVLSERVKSYNRQHRNWNSAVEVAADPLLPVSGSLKGAKAAKWLPKVAGETRVGSWAVRASETAKQWRTNVFENKVVKWLNSEAKSPGEILRDTIAEAKKNQRALQDAHFSRIRQIDRKMSGGSVDFGVFDDFAKLSDDEAKIIQRMVDGKLTARDRLLLAGKNYEPIRNRLEGIAQRWQSFAEQMKLSDEVKNTRFGAGKRTYSPHTVWMAGDRAKYNFRLRSKGRVQNAEDFAQGAVDRYIASDYGRSGKASRARLASERERIVSEYNLRMQTSKNKVAKMERWAKSPINRVRSLSPMRLWKKSVLAWRPAWTVNNIGYNTQASVLAAGPRALVEQAKMLNPRYAMRVRHDLPHDVYSNLGKEFYQKGKLNRFYSGVENTPRIAAYKVLREKGFSHEESLKRVNRYMLNYTTKNWERPLKAVMPFWSFQKGVAKAASTMPFDRPAYAVAYNRLDRYQQDAFERDFGSLVPELQKLGYSESEIQKFKETTSKYYAGKLKIGKRYFNTPFNAFSEKGLTSVGANPFLAAVAESVDSVDSFGRPISGDEASLLRRLITKFPQAELGRRGYSAWRVEKGLDKPSKTYIGKPGSQGFGLTKEKQGYDSSKTTYVDSMDPRKGLKEDLWAFAGKPRTTVFDKPKFIEAKKLQRVTAEYFASSAKWDELDYNEGEIQRKVFFKRFGMTADDFYKGVLARYDTEHTKKIKSEKERAGKLNKSLFDEYAKVPQGQRNMWATKKLRELNAAGYFDSNPYLKSFKWVNKDTAARADRQAAWLNKTPSAKSVAYKEAKRTGDWTEYRKRFGDRRKSSPYTYAGKFFKTSDSMEKFKAMEFWKRYGDATQEERKKLLLENPQYNTRKDWTPAMWSAWKSDAKRKDLAKLRGWNNAAQIMDEKRAESLRQASRFNSKRGQRRKKVAYA